MPVAATLHLGGFSVLFQTYGRRVLVLEAGLSNGLPIMIHDTSAPCRHAGDLSPSVWRSLVKPGHIDYSMYNRCAAKAKSNQTPGQVRLLKPTVSHILHNHIFEQYLYYFICFLSNLFSVLNI